MILFSLFNNKIFAIIFFSDIDILLRLKYFILKNIPFLNHLLYADKFPVMSGKIKINYLSFDLTRFSRHEDKIIIMIKNFLTKKWLRRVDTQVEVNQRGRHTFIQA